MTKMGPEWLYSIRTKLFGTMLIFVVIAAFLSLGRIERFLEAVFRHRTEEEVSVLAEGLKASFRQRMLLQNDAYTQETLMDVGQTGHVQRILIVDLDGEAAYAFPASERNHTIEIGPIPPSTRSSLTTAASGQTLYRLVTPFVNEPRCHKCHDAADRFNGALLIERSAEPEFDALETIRRRLVETWVFTTGILGLVILGITTVYVHRPVQRLIEGARRIGAGDPSARVVLRGRGELPELGESFNQMAERLEASAVENARLYSDLGESKRKIEELFNLGVMLQEPLSLEDRLDLILTGTQTVLGFDRINVLLANPDKKMLRAVASRGTGESLERLQVPLGPDGGGIAKAFLECKDIVWEGAGPVPDEWRLAHPYSEMAAFRSKAFVNVPLIVRGTVIGVLGADNKFSQRPITVETIHLLKAFAAHAAIAIDNALLYDEVKEHATEMERRVEERTKELKETQVQLIQSGKLAAVGTLAAGVAHELNQPLMVIRGYAQELLADERLADQELREDLRRIEGQTTRMVAIITHLRDFSRQSKGKREPTDLNHVVTQAFTFLAQHLKTRNIDVIQELDPALPTVWADSLQIEQIVINLVTNARDAMEATGSGTITIHTGRTQDGRVALTVTDTGPGIPPDLQERIFDPFFTTKEVGKGTGLGLSICHGILEEHGGELRVQSPVAEGRGARFTIVMPLSLRDSAGRVRA